jgi:hypothetical protein
MKKLVGSIALVAFSITGFAQKDVPVKPWLDVSTKEAFKQGDDGTLQMYIKMKGSDYEACKVKAEKAAIYIAIFEGYDANVAANIPKTGPLAKESVYDQNLAYFDAFFADGGKYKSYISKCDKHPTMIAEMKLDKKTIEANLIVTIRKKSLQERLLEDKIIQPLMSSEVQPATVLIVPDDSFLDGKYSKEIDAGGYMTTVYDLVKGVKDQAIETAINTVASAMSGEGSGLLRIEVGEAQSALEIQSAVDEMSSGLTSKKKTASEMLNERATWDYTVKMNVKEKVDGTARNLTFEIKIVDMYTLTSETATPITLVLSSSGNRDQQIQRAINGAVDDLRSRIAKNYQKKVEVGLGGKAEFYIAEGSKKNFNSMVNVEGGTEKFSEVINFILGEQVSKDTEPQLEGSGTENVRKYRNVIIPFETVVTTMGKSKKKKNSFENLGNQIQKQLTTFVPGATCTIIPTLGTIQVFIKL